MATGGERDWTKLPNELLGLIAERLTVFDYIRFGLVCVSWASTLDDDDCSGSRPRRRLYRPQVQSPLVMLPDEHGEFSKSCVFFSLSEHKSYRVPSLPELRGKWWVSSSHGWVVTLDKSCQMYLFNPFTRTQLCLPSITTLPHVELIIHDSQDKKTKNRKKKKKESQDRRYVCGFREYLPRRFREIGFHKVVLSSAPAAAAVHADYIAMAIIGTAKDLAFARAGDDKWTSLNGEEKLFVEDVIYHKGKIYSIDLEAEVRAWDISGPSPVATIVSKEIERKGVAFLKYLVESSGDLLMVWRNHEIDFSARCFITTDVRVFKFNSTSCEWIQVNSLGDQCLFLGLSRSMSLSARNISGFMPNCIYFTDYYWTPVYGGKDMLPDMVAFNLEDGSFKRYYSFDSPIYWPSPMWILPDLFF